MVCHHSFTVNFENSIAPTLLWYQKHKAPTRITKYMWISLCNAVYKLISKVLVNKVVVGWEKSPLDNVKINLDVAQMGNKAFFVVVARDCNGVIILVATKEILIGDYVVVEA